MASVKDMFDEVQVNDEEPSRREMDRIPDGTYKALITDFSVFSTAEGDFYVSWWFEIDEGAASGAQLQSFSSVGPRSVAFIKRGVQRVTGSFPSWQEMFDEEAGRTGPVRGQVMNRRVQVTQKTNTNNGKDYVNVYIDKLIGKAKPRPAAQDDVDVDDLF